MIAARHAADLDAIREDLPRGVAVERGRPGRATGASRGARFPEDAVVEGRIRVAPTGRHRRHRRRVRHLRHATDAWELEDLFVDPGHMRRGIATALVRHLSPRRTFGESR